MNSTSSTKPRALLAAGLAVGAAVLGFAGYRLFQASASAQSSLTTQEQASAVPAAPMADDAAPVEAAPKPKTIPDVLPDVTLANVVGKPTKLASFGGRPLMVNFWATWCAPCRREIPLLNKIREQRKVQNVEIVGIAVDFRDDVLKYLQKMPISYPLLIGEEDGLAAAEAFGMGMAFPFSIFVDSQNRILAVKIGELHEDEANFAFDRIRDIDSGKLTREAGRAAVADAFRRMAADRAKAAPNTEKTASN